MPVRRYSIRTNMQQSRLTLVILYSTVPVHYKYWPHHQDTPTFVAFLHRYFIYSFLESLKTCLIIPFIQFFFWLFFTSCKFWVIVPFFLMFILVWRLSCSLRNQLNKTGRRQCPIWCKFHPKIFRSQALRASRTILTPNMPIKYCSRKQDKNEHANARFR